VMNIVGKKPKYTYLKAMVNLPGSGSLHSYPSYRRSSLRATAAYCPTEYCGKSTHSSADSQLQMLWGLLRTTQPLSSKQMTTPPPREACAPDLLTPSNFEQNHHRLGKHVAAGNLACIDRRKEKELPTWYAAMRWPAASASAGVSSCSPFSSSAM
jgi:hypothetical protein